MPKYYNGVGDIVEADPRWAEAQGYSPVTTGDEYRQSISDAEQADIDSGGALGAVKATGSGFFSGLSLGGSDALIGAVSTGNEKQRLAKDIQANPGKRMVGEIAGMIVPAIVNPASLLGKSPAGALSQFTGKIATAGRLEGGAAGTAKILAAGGFEGAVQNAGQYIGHAAIEDKEITAEGFAGAFNTGGVYGAGGAGAVLGISKGAVSVRRMFSRVMKGGEAEALSAKSAWEQTSAARLDADTANMNTAREQLAEMRAQYAAADAAKNRAGINVRNEQGYAQVANEDAAAARKAMHAEAKAAKDADVAAFKEGASPAGEKKVSVQWRHITPEQKALSGEVAAPGNFKPSPEWQAVPDGEVLPPGGEYKMDLNGGNQARWPDMKAKPALPDYAAVAKDDVISTIDASALEEAGFYQPPGVGKDVVKAGKASKAIKEGQTEAINITVSPEGKYFVEDGRHRLAAAIEQGTPIKVKWTRGVEALDGEFSPQAWVKSEGVAPKFEPGGYAGGTQPNKYMAKMKAVVDEDLGVVAHGAESEVASIRAAREAHNAAEFEAVMGKSAARKMEELETAVRELEEAQAKAAPHLNPAEAAANPNKTVPGGSPVGFAPIAAAEADDAVFRWFANDAKHTPGGARMSALADDPRRILPSGEIINAEAGASRQLARQLNVAPEDALLRAEMKVLRDAPPVGRELSAAERLASEDSKRVFERLGERARNAPGGARMSGLADDARRMPSGAAKRKLTEQLDLAHEDALLHAESLPPGPAHDAALAEAAGIEKQLADDALPDDLVGDVARAVEDIHAYEKVSAKLADALGEAAHPVSRDAAAEFVKAEAAAVDKTMARGVRAAEDYNHPARMSSKDRVAYAKQRKIDADLEFVSRKEAHEAADVSHSAAKRRLGDTKKAVAAEKKLQPKEGMSKGKGLLGAATGIEGLDMLGIDIPGLPKAHDIPVIGPLLGAWLKYRAMKAVAGRFMGKVAASGEAKAATLASRTRDKVATAVDRSLGLAAEKAPKARQPIVTAMAALGRSIHGGEESKADVRANAKARIDEIAAYVNSPDAIINDVRREMHDVSDPDLIKAAEDHRRASFTFILSKMPMRPPQSPFSHDTWQPSASAALALGRRLAAMSDPAGAFEDAASGSLTMEASETVRGVYPKLFAEARDRLITRMSEATGNVSLARKAALSLLYQMPLSPSFEPRNVRIVQGIYEPANTLPPQGGMTGQTPPTPSIAGNTDMNALYQMSSDRRSQ